MAAGMARRGGYNGAKRGRGRDEGQNPAKRKREETSRSSNLEEVCAKRLHDVSFHRLDQGPTLSPSLECAHSTCRGDEDPYSPTKLNAPKALPESEEWQFRLKFVCRNDPQDDMFKEAVQGLLKICFPSGVLDEIGVDVIESQMQEKGASPDQVKAMREVARVEMVHRLSWLLAELLDTSHRTQVAISTIVTGSHRIHGTQFDQGALNDLVESFESLREDQINVNRSASTRISNSPPMQEAELDADPMVIEDFDKKELVELERATVSDGPCEDLESERRPSWIVDNATELPLSEIRERFTKPRHLFSSHALTHVRDDLGEGATYAEMRAVLLNWWRALPDKEKETWRTSYQNLLAGDMTMLIPQEFQNRYVNINAQNRLPQTSSKLLQEEDDHPDRSLKHKPGTASCSSLPPHSRQESGASERDQIFVPLKTSIKATKSYREVNKLNEELQESESKSLHPKVTLGQTPDAMDCPPAFFHASQERCIRENAEADAPISAITTPREARGFNAPPNAPTGPRSTLPPHVPVQTTTAPTLDPYRDSKTPVVDLFCGRSDFRMERDEAFVINMIMSCLRERIPSQEPSFPLPSGGSCYLDHWTAETRLQRYFSPYSSLSSSECRSKVEKDLENWVRTNPYAFSELAKCPLMFGALRTDTTPCVELVYRDGPPIIKENSDRAMNFLCGSLRDRMTPESYELELHRGSKLCQTLRAAIEALARRRRFRFLEEALRPIVFKYREKYPELKDCRLVREWEAFSGLKWMN